MLLRMLFSTRVPLTVMRMQTEASPFFSSLVFLRKNSTRNESLFMVPTCFLTGSTNVGNPTRFSVMQNIAVQRERHKFGGDEGGGFHLLRLLH